MTKPAWKPESGWGASPGTWIIYLAGERLVVTRHIDESPDVWCVVWMGHRRLLASKEIDDAKREALGRVKAWSERLAADVAAVEAP